MLFTFFKKRSWDDIQVVLIVSTGRTGTKFFGSFFNTIGVNVYSTHEPKPDISSIGPDYVKGKLTKEQAIKIVKKYRENILQDVVRKKKNVYLESNGAFTFLLPFIKEIFPNVTVIHIIRNPYDWIKSACSRPVRYKGQTIAKYSMDKNWKLTAKELPGETSLQWDTATLNQKFAWIWSMKNDYVLKNAGHVKHFRSVTFEDLFGAEKGTESIRTLLEFLKSTAGLEVKDVDYRPLLQKKENATTNFLTEGVEGWTEADKIFVNKIVGEVSRKFY